jgi:predicted RNA polymerase sigma factor
LEATTGWRFVAEELEHAGCRAHLAKPADPRALGGLRTDEIARAFLVPEPTMKRRAQGALGVRFRTA